MGFETFNTYEQEERFNPSIEVGCFEDIESTMIFYAVSKNIEEEWGNEQEEDIAKSFNSELPQELIDSYEKIKVLSKDNDETLAWLAFATDKDEEIKDFVIDQLIKHKDFTIDEAKDLLEEFTSFLKNSKDSIDVASLRDFVEKDVKNREEGLKDTQARLDEAIRFFRPECIGIEKVVYLPTNPFEKKQSGRGIDTGSTFYINSEKDNEVNEVHEFLHIIINPILEKIVLNKKEQESILDLCPDRLIDYPEPSSILAEEIIRTYGSGINKDNCPSFDNFKKRMMMIDREAIQRILDEENSERGFIAESPDELLGSDEALRTYYDRHADVLSERIWHLFEGYMDSHDNFQNYFMAHYREIVE
jgi:hypothetical protein